MMKNKLKNAVQIILLFICGAVLTYFFMDSSPVLILENEFLVTFVGVILGIAATIITFIFSATDKIWGIIDYTYTDVCKKEEVRKKFKSGYRELVEDSSYIFVIFILTLTCIIASYIDFQGISCSTWFSKMQLIQAIKMGLFLNCIVATCDLFFSLINILKLVLYEDSAKSGSGNGD